MARREELFQIGGPIVLDEVSSDDKILASVELPGILTGKEHIYPCERQFSGLRGRRTNADLQHRQRRHLLLYRRSMGEQGVSGPQVVSE